MQEEQEPVGITFADWGYRRPLRSRFVARHLDLEIAAGQHVLLLGASGIGKSTILEAVAGILGNEDVGETSAADAANGEAAAREDQEGGVTEGSLLVGGQSVREARGRCALMMQDPDAQMVLQRVGDNVAFGLENLGVPADEIWPRVRYALEQVGLEGMELDRPTSHLSGGQMQRIALAGALCMRPGVLLLDEPTANLDPAGARDVVETVHRMLRAHRSTVMIVEHRAEPWLDILDRVIVLGRAGEDGTARVVADGTPDKVFTDPSIDFDGLGIWVPSRYPAAAAQHQRMLREIAEKKAADIGKTSALSAVSAATAVANGSADDAGFRSEAEAVRRLIVPDVKFARQKAIAPGTVLLTTQDLAIGHNGTAIAEHIACEFRSGEITVLQGRNGAGKSTLSMTLAGLLPQVSGHVVASDELRRGSSASDPHDWSSAELSQRIAFVFQNPEHQFVRNTVLEEVKVGLLAVGNEPAEAARKGHALLDRFGLDDYADANPYTLSGGEKRRLTVAAALAAAPGVLILDEPTFGQDRSTWLEIVMLMRSVADSGVAVIAVTHDADLVEALADKTITVGDEATSSVHVTKQADRVEAPRPASRSRFLAGINPAFRLLGAFLVSIPLLFSLDPVSAGTALVLELLAFGAIGLHLPRVVRSVWPVLVMAPWTFLAVVLYGKHGGHTYFKWGMIHITTKSVWLACATFLRVLAVAIPAVLLMLGIDSTDLADAMSQVFHLPDRFVYGGLAGMRLLTVLKDDWTEIAQARRSRGLGDQNRVAQFFSCAFSLLVLSIRRATSLSTAMEARAFGTGHARSRARESRVHAKDWLFLVGCLVIPSLALGVSIYLGTFSLGGGK